ncbi:ribonuclease P 40kDa subunit-domain-containing protein [Jimgerdemannia flammicorona]|uniref:Ribonuclease P 40kDa subunit-domain-containing protein n=1 Tax=Jimgerdemannia flammicorona TaxID=994334 RepID=A0A433QT85_9FUNG|nr:ribonuclease P 40kDa subunit-domain-containing protein [Jimgerdemannia flammicorona]
MAYNPQFPHPKAKLFLSHSSFSAKNPRHQAIISTHPFNHEAEVFLPNTSIKDIEKIFDGISGFYYRVDLPLSFFLSQKVINQYVRSGKVAMGLARIGGGIDTDDVVALEGNGNLILSVTKDTYEQLGLPGKAAQFGPDKQRFVVQIDLTAKSMVPGKKGYDRIKWCFENTLNKKFTFFIASVNSSTGVTEEIEFPGEVEPSKIPLKRTLHESRGILIPDLNGIKTISTEDEWKQEALDFYEWLGLASLRARRSVRFIIPIARAQFDRKRMHNTMDWLHTNLPSRTNSRYITVYLYFTSITAASSLILAYHICAYSSQNLNPTHALWASFTVWGFQDSPISWRHQEHGHLVSGENHYTFVTWPDETYVLYQQLGTLDAYS